MVVDFDYMSIEIFTIPDFSPALQAFGFLSIRLTAPGTSSITALKPKAGDLQFREKPPPSLLLKNLQPETISVYLMDTFGDSLRFVMIRNYSGEIDMQKTWFITGASRGFGRIWAEAALKRGDQVTATARKLADVADLKERFGDAALPLALDVTKAEQVQQAVEQAYAHFGKLDVLVNNAGRSLFAATEEASDEQVRDLFDTNYFGMVRVLRAALPLLRKQGSGHILGVSSGLGITTLPMIGFYCATKWAVEAMHEALAHEVKAFGIKVTLVEPGAYATDFGKSSEVADALEPYAEFRQQFLKQLANVEQGDPYATADAVLKLVDADNPPLRLGLGTSILPRARAAYAERLATWEAWEDISNAAMGEPRKMSMEWIEQFMQAIPSRA
jgi:NAD(P)-dependent dehydrogenase (short-subunit alcohol dehydrogenase family)